MVLNLLDTLQIVDKIMKDDSLKKSDISDLLCKGGNVSKIDLFGQSRKEHLVVLRQSFYYILREKFKMPYKEIALLSRGEDHTTIMHGVNSIEDYFKVYGHNL